MAIGVSGFDHGREIGISGGTGKAGRQMAEGFAGNFVP